MGFSREREMEWDTFLNACLLVLVVLVQALTIPLLLKKLRHSAQNSEAWGEKILEAHILLRHTSERLVTTIDGMRSEISSHASASNASPALASLTPESTPEPLACDGPGRDDFGPRDPEPGDACV